MNIFVSGATGFLGRAFCAEACAREHEILGLCRSTDARLPAGCRALQGSLAELPWKEIKAFAPDAALHLAWIATPGEYLHSPQNDVFAAQSDGLFRGLMEIGVRHVAGVGTCIEYAPSASPLREDASPLASAFPYSNAKAATFRRLRALAEDRKCAWSWLRVFYPYGAGEHSSRFPSQVMRQLSQGKSMEVKTPGSVKDYIHVKDAAAAMLWSMERDLMGPVNIGTGAGVCILDLARMIAGIVGVDPGKVQGAVPPADDPFPVVVADMSRLHTAGWHPAVPVREGLERLWASLQN